MVATMSSFDNTTVYTITSTYTEEKKCEEESKYLEEDREWAKTGWHNPRKLPINNKYANNRIRLQIRNQLPYRLRVEENVL